MVARTPGLRLSALTSEMSAARRLIGAAKFLIAAIVCFFARENFIIRSGILDALYVWLVIVPLLILYECLEYALELHSSPIGVSLWHYDTSSFVLGMRRRYRYLVSVARLVICSGLGVGVILILHYFKSTSAIPVWLAWMLVTPLRNLVLGLLARGQSEQIHELYRRHAVSSVLGQATDPEEKNTVEYQPMLDASYTQFIDVSAYTLQSGSSLMDTESAHDRVVTAIARILFGSTYQIQSDQANKESQFQQEMTEVTPRETEPLYSYHFRNQ
jgi:hypothetical protein